jgi:hypothetical protein
MRVLGVFGKIETDKMEKRCKICGEVKSFDEFHKTNKTKDGLRQPCKICRSKIQRKVYEHKICPICNELFLPHKNTQITCSIKCSNTNYRINNYQNINEYNKNYYDLNKEKIIERANNWNKCNADYRSEYCKNYRETFKEKLKEKKLEYYSNGKKSQIDKRYYYKHKLKIFKILYDRNVRKLSNSYIKKLIIGRNNNLVYSDIPDELVKTQRIIVKIKRLIKQISND